MTDGTPDGTRLIADIRAGENSSRPEEFTAAGKRVYFTAASGETGRTLWYVSDDTEAPKPVRMGPATAPRRLVCLGDRLIFAAADEQHGEELWWCNLQSLHASLLEDVLPGQTSSSPRDFVVLGPDAYFIADRSPATPTLWKTDGTPEGTLALVGSSSIPAYAQYGGNAFLWPTHTVMYTSWNAGAEGAEPYKLDTELRDWVLVRDIFPGPASSSPKEFFQFGDRVFFSADNGSLGVELWQTNGTAESTYLSRDVNPGSKSSGPRYLTSIGSHFCFSATHSDYGRELWRCDGTVDSVALVFDIAKGPASSNPRNLVSVNGVLFFSADDGIHGEELWRSDGSGYETRMVADILPPRPIGRDSAKTARRSPTTSATKTSE
jgi:ELWxxDGT repeat protein